MWLAKARTDLSWIRAIEEHYGCCGYYNAFDYCCMDQMSAIMGQADDDYMDFMYAVNGLKTNGLSETTEDFDSYGMSYSPVEKPGRIQNLSVVESEISHRGNHPVDLNSGFESSAVDGSIGGGSEMQYEQTYEKSPEGDINNYEGTIIQVSDSDMAYGQTYGQTYGESSEGNFNNYDGTIIQGSDSDIYGNYMADMPYENPVDTTTAPNIYVDLPKVRSSASEDPGPSLVPRGPRGPLPGSCKPSHLNEHCVCEKAMETGKDSHLGFLFMPCKFNISTRDPIMVKDSCPTKVRYSNSQEGFQIDTG